MSERTRLSLPILSLLTAAAFLAIVVVLRTAAEDKPSPKGEEVLAVTDAPASAPAEEVASAPAELVSPPEAATVVPRSSMPLEDDEPVEVDAAAPADTSHPFLPPGLARLELLVPEELTEFDAAEPIDQLHQARELLSHSIAVILCARGPGPIPVADAGHLLSHTGQEGMWSFQINDSIFHFDELEFPEYAEYIPLLSSVYDDEMVLVVPDEELPPVLADHIRMRAHEALSYL